MKQLLMTICLLAVMAMPALADTNYDVCFSSLDIDGDGSISKSEFLIAFSDGDMELFDEADVDEDGDVTHGEWEEFKAGKGFEEGGVQS